MGRGGGAHQPYDCQQYDGRGARATLATTNATEAEGMSMVTLVSKIVTMMVSRKVRELADEDAQLESGKGYALV